MDNNAGKETFWVIPRLDRPTGQLKSPAAACNRAWISSFHRGRGAHYTSAADAPIITLHWRKNGKPNDRRPPIRLSKCPLN
ncbi:hypothetical protein ANTPLA_LOCUS8467 [Anthophora plagiata]